MDITHILTMIISITNNIGHNSKVNPFTNNNDFI